jgi:hypothetical protein
MRRSLNISERIELIVPQFFLRFASWMAKSLSCCSSVRLSAAIGPPWPPIIPGP